MDWTVVQISVEFNGRLSPKGTKVKSEMFETPISKYAGGSRKLQVRLSELGKVIHKVTPWKSADGVIVNPYPSPTSEPTATSTPRD
jgi:hypothetical protein